MMAGEMMAGKMVGENEMAMLQSKRARLRLADGTRLCAFVRVCARLGAFGRV